MMNHPFSPCRKTPDPAVEDDCRDRHDVNTQESVPTGAFSRTEMLLGAAAMRDIGYHFPDTKGNEYEGIDSKILLRRVMAMLREAGYELGNCDITICAQAPKLNPYIDAMQACLAEVMGVQPNQVSLKATTTEHLGFVGREEGIAAYAVALLESTK